LAAAAPHNRALDGDIFLSLAIIFLYYFYGKEPAMRRLTEPDPPPAADQPAILTKATLKAAALLGVTNKVLARVLGVSEATVSRMQGGKYTLRREEKAFELAVLFIRLYRSLDAIVAGDDAVAASWLKNRNTALDGKPLAMIQTVSGLTHVLAYLDARRAIV
jgi:hypothetical protein